MSVGITGPIGRDLLPYYCLARTFWLPDRRVNRAKAACKICGEALDKGDGVEAHITGGGQVYLCGRCVHEVAMAHVTVDVCARRHARGKPLIEVFADDDDEEDSDG